MINILLMLFHFMSLKKNDFKANPTHPSIQVTLGRPSQLRGPMELRTHLQGVKVVSTYTASCQPTEVKAKPTSMLN